MAATGAKVKQSTISSTTEDYLDIGYNGDRVGYNMPDPDPIAYTLNLSAVEIYAKIQASDNVFSVAVPTAITLAAVDSPFIPIGDIVGAVILAGATTYDATQRTFVTYTMTNSKGQTYVGRTSGYGNPYSIMMRRFSGHHMRGFGGTPVLDRAVQGYHGYPAIRGR